MSIPQTGENMSKRRCGNIGCKDEKTSSWHLIGFPDGTPIVITLGQQYHVGEKPTVVILYTYIIINRPARTPSKTTTKDTMSLNRFQFFTLGLGSDGVSIIILVYHIISDEANYRLTRQETRFCFLIIIR